MVTDKGCGIQQECVQVLKSMVSKHKPFPRHSARGLGIHQRVEEHLWAFSKLSDFFNHLDVDLRYQ